MIMFIAVVAATVAAAATVVAVAVAVAHLPLLNRGSWHAHLHLPNRGGWHAHLHLLKRDGDSRLHLLSIHIHNIIIYYEILI